VASIEIIFFRRPVCYTIFYHKSNEEILEELKVEPVDDNLRSTNQIGYEDDLEDL
jgi:hypothetical protein